MKIIRTLILVAVLGFAAAPVWAVPKAPLSAEARVRLAAFARKALSGEVKLVVHRRADGALMTIHPSELKGMPKELLSTKEEQVFITVFRDRAPNVRLGSQSPGLLMAVVSAMTKARTLPSFDFHDFGDPASVGLLIERASDSYTVPPARWFTDLPFMKIGIHGLTITHEKRKGTLPPSASLLDGFTSPDSFINELCARLKLHPKRVPVSIPGAIVWDKTKTRVELVTFETLLSRGPSEPVVPLYRVNDLNAPPWTDKLVAARRLGSILVRHQDPRGRYFSKYDGQKGRYLRSQYSMIDHCYAIVALGDLAAETIDKRYVESARRAVDFLMKRIERRKEDRIGNDKANDFAFVLFDKKAKLGSAAMAVVALDRFATLTKSAEHDDDMRRLGRLILAMQYNDGSFRHYYRYDKKVPLPYRMTSATCPGQAAWALAVLARRFKQQSWRRSVDKAIEYLVTSREKDMKWTVPPADIWLAAAMGELPTSARKKSYLEYARRMADDTLKRQKLKDISPDMIGSFEGDVSGSCRGAAARVRLIAQVQEISPGSDEKRKASLAAMRRAAFYLRLNQLRPNNAFYVAKPHAVYGMIRVNPFRNTVRLDTTCHALEALLRLRRAEKAAAEKR